MKLTNYIIDMGRVVAYYPNLKKVTGSTTASILLCQFLYWLDKTKTGWIYKDSYEIEEETGLSIYEQQTARKILLELNILSEEYKRLDHKIAFKINQEVLNSLWEQQSGIESTHRFQKVEENEKPIPVPQPVNLRDFQDPALHPDHPANRTDAIKQGDLVDAYVDFAKSPGARKEMIKNEIRNNMENKFHINMTGKEWESFIEYVYGRQERHNEPAERFVQWALIKGFDPMYWTPKKCLTMYPQAFIGEQDKIRADFVEKPPEHVEENYAEMPEHLKKKKKLY
jgi:hypothetical protein